MDVIDYPINSPSDYTEPRIYSVTDLNTAYDASTGKTGAINNPHLILALNSLKLFNSFEDLAGRNGIAANAFQQTDPSKPEFGVGFVPDKYAKLSDIDVCSVYAVGKTYSDAVFATPNSDSPKGIVNIIITYVYQSYNVQIAIRRATNTATSDTNKTVVRIRSKGGNWRILDTSTGGTFPKQLEYDTLANDYLNALYQKTQNQGATGYWNTKFSSSPSQEPTGVFECGDINGNDIKNGLCIGVVTEKRHLTGFNLLSSDLGLLFYYSDAGKISEIVENKIKKPIIYKYNLFAVPLVSGTNSKVYYDVSRRFSITSNSTHEPKICKIKSIRNENFGNKSGEFSSIGIYYDLDYEYFSAFLFDCIFDFSSYPSILLIESMNIAVQNQILFDEYINPLQFFVSTHIFCPNTAYTEVVMICNRSRSYSTSSNDVNVISNAIINAPYNNPETSKYNIMYTLAENARGTGEKKGVFLVKNCYQLKQTSKGLIGSFMSYNTSTPQQDISAGKLLNTGVVGLMEKTTNNQNIPFYSVFSAANTETTNTRSIDTIRVGATEAINEDYSIATMVVAEDENSFLIAQFIHKKTLDNEQVNRKVKMFFRDKSSFLSASADYIPDNFSPFEDKNSGNFVLLDWSGMSASNLIQTTDGSSEGSVPVEGFMLDNGFGYLVYNKPVPLGSGDVQMKIVGLKKNNFLANN